jgi:hypothetical protein
MKDVNGGKSLTWPRAGRMLVASGGNDVKSANVNRCMKSGFWKTMALVFAAVLLFMLILHLTAALPKPVVTLAFQGFKKSGTNTYAIIRISNSGKSTVWREPDAWDLEAETPNGWTTNRSVHFTSVPWPLPPTSNEMIFVQVPPDAIRWRVRAGYGYYDHHHVRYEFAVWAIKHHLTKYVFSSAGECIGWILRLLPEPIGREGDVSTVVLTNRAPVLTNLPIAFVK